MNENSFVLKNTFDRAVKAYKISQLHESEMFFTSILKKNPNHSQTIFYLGMIALKNKEFDKAKIFSQKAIKINPTFAEAHHNLGESFKNLGETEKAIVSYKAAITRKPNLFASYNNLGNLLKEKGENKKAVEYFLSAIKINPKSFESYNNLGIVYKLLKDYTRAIECFKNSIEINTQFYMAHYNLGKMYKEMKKYEDAIKYLKTVNTKRAKAEVLESIYLSNNLKAYSNTLKKFSVADGLNLRVATIASYVSKKENIKNDYPFCRSPFDYISVQNIKTEINNPDKFSFALSEALKSYDFIWQPASKSTTGGFHTSGNLFNSKSSEIKKLEEEINKKIKVFRKEHSKQKDFFITKWPSKSNIEAWHVKLLKKGFQTSHIHPSGWLSGCFYLKIPSDLKKDEGAIKFTLSGYDYPFDKKLPVFTYTPKVFDLVLFPSSLFHETIPFNSKQERHVIAFDIMPTR
jgi:uncharacterized protein (TIGR02466 family)